MPGIYYEIIKYKKNNSTPKPDEDEKISTDFFSKKDIETICTPFLQKPKEETTETERFVQDNVKIMLEDNEVS